MILKKLVTDSFDDFKLMNLLICTLIHL